MPAAICTRWCRASITAPDSCPPTGFASEIARLGIRSVVNLRGSNMGRDWYLSEIAAARERGVTHSISACRQESPADPTRAAELLTLLRAAPKPVLVHCEGGADRTGLATALYLAAEANEPTQQAGRALSWRYGHLGLPVQHAWPMDQSWQRLAPLIRSGQLSANVLPPSHPDAPPRVLSFPCSCHLVFCCRRAAVARSIRRPQKGRLAASGSERHENNPQRTGRPDRSRHAERGADGRAARPLSSTC